MTAAGLKIELEFVGFESGDLRRLADQAVQAITFFVDTVISSCRSSGSGRRGHQAGDRGFDRSQRGSKFMSDRVEDRGT